MGSEVILEAVYKSDVCRINIVSASDGAVPLYKLEPKEGAPNYSQSLDQVIDESVLDPEQKNWIKNDLNLNPTFF